MPEPLIHGRITHDPGAGGASFDNATRSVVLGIAAEPLIVDRQRKNYAVRSSWGTVERWGAVLEHVRHEVDQVGDVDFGISIYVSFLVTFRRGAALEHVGHEVDEIGDIDLLLNIIVDVPTNADAAVLGNRHGRGEQQEYKQTAERPKRTDH